MRGKLETEQNCNILTPTLMAITAFLSRSPGLLNRVPGGPASLGHGPYSSIFFPTDSHFLCTELCYCFTSTQFNLSTVKVIPLTSSTGCTCYLHRCISYFDCLAGSEVNKQQYTVTCFMSVNGIETKAVIQWNVVKFVAQKWSSTIHWPPETFC